MRDSNMLEMSFFYFQVVQVHFSKCTIKKVIYFQKNLDLSVCLGWTRWWSAHQMEYRLDYTVKFIPYKVFFQNDRNTYPVFSIFLIQKVCLTRLPVEPDFSRSNLVQTVCPGSNGLLSPLYRTITHINYLVKDFQFYRLRWSIF